jgi:hypothetical protein
MMLPRLCTFLCLLQILSAFGQDKLVWHDVRQWGLEGRGWADQERHRWFDRLPAQGDETLTEAVWSLSRHSAGMMVRFKTDATAIHARWKVMHPKLGMPHMPPSGVSGLDLYARGPDGEWRWAAATMPTKQEMQARLLGGIAPGEHEFALYLPLYNGTESLEIGVPAEAVFEGLLPRKAKPLVFYGTSITHGACASRPGMAHPAILGRWLDMPVINLGFSGNGKMHEAVGDFMVEIDAAAYIIDCLPNMHAAMVKERCVPFVKRLREARPHTPIILVEDRRFPNAWLIPSKSKFHDENHAALRTAYETLKGEGIASLHYLEGDGLLGDDFEGTTDASHPNDLGFLRQAQSFAPVLRAAIGLE